MQPKLNISSIIKKVSKTPIGEKFLLNPLGYIDVGSFGGVHGMTRAVAQFLDVMCFEPDPVACKELKDTYSLDNPFHHLEIVEQAVGKADETESILYVTESPMNCSLYAPDKEFVRRYDAKGFGIKHTANVKTCTLDSILKREHFKDKNYGEFLKLDAQGAEFDILQGAEAILKERCIALWCEVEFFSLYEGQKLFSDIDAFLRKCGFCLYGLYPNFRSTKALDPRTQVGEERLMWADAVYFKDPLDPLNKGRNFSPREIDCLLLSAIMTKYYDFALEITKRFISCEKERASIFDWVLALSSVDSGSLLVEVDKLKKKCESKSEHSGLYIGQFVSRHKGNHDFNFIIE